MLIKRGYIFAIYILAFLLSTKGYAQVPNIIMTDIEGNERNLYQSLDEGKVVVVEVFATWCANCWKLYKSEKLERLYNTYGPNGTNQLEVFFIEIDPTTNEDMIHGVGSFGDWTEDLSYPVFNPSQISQEFIEVFADKGVPTSYVICPASREIVADIFQNNLAETIEILQSCNTISEVTDLQVAKPVFSEIGICRPTDVLVEVINTGTEAITELSLSVTNGNEIIFDSISTPVNIASGRGFKVHMGYYSLPENFDTQVLNYNITTEDDVLNNNTIPIVYSEGVEVFNELQLTIRSDAFANLDNTRWWIENSNGEVVVPVTFLEANTETVEYIALENNECFTFIIEDGFGDGILFGEIELKTIDGIVLFDEEFFRNKGEVSFEYVGFIATSVDTNLESDFSFNLLSTLVSNNLNAQIQFPNYQEVELNIVNLQGQVINSKTIIGDKQLIESVDVSNLNDGVYFLQLSTQEGVLTKKFVKQ